MDVAVSEAKARLTDLVRRAEAGEEIVLTRHGHAAVRLVPVSARPATADRRSIIEALRRSAAAKALPGSSAARSGDDLYGEDGLPG